MRAVIVIAPRDFKDETVKEAKMMFEKWKVEPVLASFTTKECIGSHGAVYKPTLKVQDISSNDFDVLFLADGKGVETFKLYEQFPLLDLVRSFNANGKIVAGVDNGMKVVARANIITNKKIAMPSEKETASMILLYRGVLSEKPMEAETNIASLGGSGKTADFVGAILDKLGVR